MGAALQTCRWKSLTKGVTADLTSQEKTSSVKTFSDSDMFHHRLSKRCSWQTAINNVVFLEILIQGLTKVFPA